MLVTILLGTILVECPGLWASGSEPAAIVRCLSRMIGLVNGVYEFTGLEWVDCTDGVDYWTGALELWNTGA